jgi:hypothetical protein
VVAAALLAMALVATGCASSGEVSGSAPTARSTATAEPTPTPTPTQTIAPRADYLENMIGCLRVHGWEAERAHGSISAPATEEQRPALAEDFATCEAQFGYDQPIPGLSPEEARLMLEKLDTAAACLVAAGYPVPARPTDEAALAGLTSTPSSAGWAVYGDVPEDQLSQAQDACPPLWF